MTAPHALLVSELSKTVMNIRAAEEQPTRAPTALLFRFPFPGPWGKDLTEHAHELARDIAGEAGLVWKIWLEDRKTGHAGGVYLFENAFAAARYREKHERRLSAMGLAGVEANAFQVNVGLSVLTRAAPALDLVRAGQRGGFGGRKAGEDGS